jgi:hypothetical protein
MDQAPDKTQASARSMKRGTIYFVLSLVWLGILIGAVIMIMP